MLKYLLWCFCAYDLSQLHKRFRCRRHLVREYLYHFSQFRNMALIFFSSAKLLYMCLMLRAYKEFRSETWQCKRNGTSDFKELCTEERIHFFGVLLTAVTPPALRHRHRHRHLSGSLPLRLPLHRISAAGQNSKISRLGESALSSCVYLLMLAQRMQTSIANTNLFGGFAWPISTSCIQAHLFFTWITVVWNRRFTSTTPSDGSAGIRAFFLVPYLVWFELVVPRSCLSCHSWQDLDVPLARSPPCTSHSWIREVEPYWDICFCP